MDFELDNVLVERMADVAAICDLIIYGANQAGAEVLARLRSKNRQAAFFVDDAPRVSEFEGLPLYSIHDLWLADLTGKFIAIAVPDRLSEWSAQTMNLLSLGLRRGLDYLSVLKSPLKFNLDANIGHNYMAGELQGFRVWGDLDNPGARLIVTLGGSTTDPFRAPFSSFYASWSEKLYQRLTAFSDNIVVCCGGVGAYTSTQDLLKLIRDVLPLGPKVVISYGGANDFNQYVGDFAGLQMNRYRRPFLSSITETYYRNTSKVFFDHGRRQAEREFLGGLEVSYGLRNSKNAARFWVDNMRMMHALGKEFEFSFLGILQPMPIMLKNSRLFPQIADEFMPSFINRHNQYINDSVREAASLAKDFDYILDFTSLFDEMDEYLYCDWVHVSPLGNEIIAEAVQEYLLRSELV